MLELERIDVRFPLARGRFTHAVDQVSFSVAAGEALGLVGESGCGKSTLARVINRLVEPHAGHIRLDNRDIAAIPPRTFARDPARRTVQMVFQDATDSLDPHLTAEGAIAAPLRTLLRLDRPATRHRVQEAAALCGLPSELLGRYPHQLSGGQKARVGIARAIAPGPKLLVLDEPTSALDVSVQAVILRLFDDIRTRLGTALLFISHDLGVVRLLCSRVIVMLAGQVVETGPAAALFDTPAHPYTRALVDSVPDPARRGRPAPAEHDPAVILPPQACRFAARCPAAADICWAERPRLRPVGPSREAACHLAGI